MLLRVTALTALGAGLSARVAAQWWLLGQALLGAALVQWFVLLHECGHGTLSGVPGVDRWVGRLAGVLTVIPFQAWRRVHARHHRWAGWQDLDPTTAALAPRPRSRALLGVVDLVWWTGVPLLALLYRLQNYWHLPRLLRLFPTRRGALTGSLLATAAWWSVAAYAAGPLGLLRWSGLALLLSFLVQEQLILSQHTHLPQRRAGGASVRPVPAAAQVEYTRSLRVPSWVSRWLLLGIEAHALHHAHPLVPGYRLRELKDDTPHALPWWRFVLTSRRMRGSRFLFLDRTATGVRV